MTDQTYAPMPTLEPHFDPRGVMYFDLPGVGRWPDPGTHVTATRDDRSHLPGGPAAPLLEGATWISHPETAVAPKGERPAYEFRRTLHLEEDPTQTTLAVTAHGVYEAFVNGARVGDEELTPGTSAYHSTLYVQSFDVTDLLRVGQNEVRIVLSDGWFRGQTGASRVADHFGTRTGIIARMTAAGDDWSHVLVTDTSWQTAPGPILAADLMEGEIHDFRRIGHETWVEAVVSDDPLTTDRSRLDTNTAPPIRRFRELPATSVTRLDSGRQIVDFGANINGHVRLTNLGPRGTTTTLLHAEHVGPDGDVDRLAFTGFDHVTREALSPGQRDVVISRGDPSDAFEPRHSTKGFRYVAVDGRADDLHSGDLIAVEVRSDLTRTGWFACSDPDLTRLHEVAYNTWRANTCGVPTDCPTRERAGFTGDHQIFVPMAAYLEDVRSFSRSWLRAVADEQFDSGALPNVAPTCGFPANGLPFSFAGSAGWGDAVTIVPWQLYQAYGDATILSENLPMMCRWLDRVEAVAAGFRHASRTARGPEQPHEHYLWDAGFHWGEWLEPGAQWNPMNDHGIIATAYFHLSARLASKAAAVIGDQPTAARYADLADRVRDAWRTEFWVDGRLTQESQANYVRALRLGLVPDTDRAAAVERLVQLVHDAFDHLATGFLSTPWLLPVLADAGHAHLAYTILQQRDYPGWLLMLDRGATTIWENWEGIHDDGTAEASLSHYSKGGVIGFFHSHIAGLRLLEPGWKRFAVKPVPGGGIRWATAALDSASGHIEVAWQLSQDLLTAQVTVPHGTTALVELPGTRPVEVGGGHHTLTGRIPRGGGDARST